MFAEYISGSYLGYFGIFSSILISLALVAGISLLVVLVVLLVRRLTNSPATNPREVSAEDAVLSARDILQIRYVCGEITRDQYFQMLGDLA